jgi:hypothetical protein
VAEPTSLDRAWSIVRQQFAQVPLNRFGSQRQFLLEHIRPVHAAPVALSFTGKNWLVLCAAMLPIWSSYNL